MSSKNPVRYTERFKITHNRYPVRVVSEVEVTIDLATIRRILGLRAVCSMGRKSQSKFIKVVCVTQPEIIGKATSQLMEVGIE